MPYVPPKPIAKGVPAVTQMGATGGAGQFTAIDNSPAIAALVDQLGAIQYYVSGGPGGAASKETGSMTALMSAQVIQLQAIAAQLKLIHDKASDGTSSAQEAAKVVAQSIDNLAGIVTEIAINHALQVADQVDHNEFTQQATNTARKESKKDPIEVKEDDVKGKIQKGVKQISTMQTVAKVAGVATNIASNVTSYTFNLAKGYLQDTAIGQWLTTQITAVKKAAQQLEQDAKAKSEKVQKKADADTAAKVPGATPNE